MTELRTGDKAPGFTLRNTAGEERSLTEFTDEDHVVLLFFPLAFSDVCTEELCTVRDNMKLYNSLSAKVIGISVDSFFALREFKKANNLNFILLSDFNREVSRLYGVLYDDYYGMKGVSKRAAFVINPRGVITHKEVSEDSAELPDFSAIHSALA